MRLQGTHDARREATAGRRSRHTQRYQQARVMNHTFCTHAGGSWSSENSRPPATTLFCHSTIYHEWMNVMNAKGMLWILRRSHQNKHHKSHCTSLCCHGRKYRVCPDLILTHHGGLCPLPHALYDQPGNSAFICLALLQTEADLLPTGSQACNSLMPAQKWWQHGSRVPWMLKSSETEEGQRNLPV